MKLIDCSKCKHCIHYRFFKKNKRLEHQLKCEFNIDIRKSILTCSKFIKRCK